jgi:hypothetical protein
MNDWLAEAPGIFTSPSHESDIVDDATKTKGVEQTQCRGRNRLHHENRWVFASEQQGPHTKFDQPDCGSRCGSAGAGNDYIECV